MTRLRPFFNFYGSKWTLAPRYNPPQHGHLIECCAGSASYATLHHAQAVTLVDIDPVICSVWDYLIRVPEREVMALPLRFDHVDELTVPEETKSFLGFWLNKANPRPCKSLSKWGRQQRDTGEFLGFWCERIRLRVASQLQHIRHWRVLNCSYAEIPEQQATYFVDPPYERMGYRYRFNKVDFAHLGDWCKNRAAAGSQVIACEAEGASWLPFEVLHAHRGNRLRRYREMVCNLPAAV